MFGKNTARGALEDWLEGMPSTTHIEILSSSNEIKFSIPPAMAQLSRHFKK